MTRWPDENIVSQIPDAPTLGRLVDPSGRLWVLRRHLDDSATRKLAARTDEMLIGDGFSGSYVAADDREALWASIEKSGYAPDEEPDELVRYTTFEFDSEDGSTLLYLRRSC